MISERFPSPPTVAAVIDELVERHGESERDRAETGVQQAAARWVDADGDAESFSTFCIRHFVPRGDDLVRLRDRLEEVIVSLGLHLYELRRLFRRGSDLRPEGGPAMRAYDALLAQLDPAPDLMDQMYRQGLAFAALLNFERPDLDAMLADGGDWDADRWTEVRIARSFGPRIPGELNDHARKIRHEADLHVSEFHVPVETLVDEHGRRWLEPGRRLIAHWLIRDQVKAHYGDPEGLPRQRALMHVMRRMIEGAVPMAVLDGTDAGDWDPSRNAVGDRIATELNGPERYRHLLAQFHLAREFDAHHPEHPTAMARKFELEREIPEVQVEALLVEALSAPERGRVAAALRARLGRPLEAHDIYLERLAEPRSGEERDALVDERYPDEKAFERGLPDLLQGLGFPSDEARRLGRAIRVEIARGAGHAMRPGLPGSQAWLRTSRRPESLGWDGFDTAMHELGHSLEQLVSSERVPRPMLRGVPNTACTEAFAFLYQSLAPRVIGAESEGEREETARLRGAEALLETCQIGGPALLELYVWRWLYENPEATPEALRERTLAIAADLWARYFEEEYGPDPFHTLAAYQHMVAYPLYLADYALGHIMTYQIRSHVDRSNLAEETIRICSIGRITPDQWMREAVGAPISIEPMLEGVRGVEWGQEWA
jgi:hypothetical protein